MVTKRSARPYAPIKDEINLETTLSQAASALDIAAEYGVESKSPEVMVQVAALWIEMSAALIAMSSNSEDEEDDEDDVTSNVVPLGFGPNTPKGVTANGNKSS